MRMLAQPPDPVHEHRRRLIAGFAMFGTFVLVPNFVEMPHGLPAAAARGRTTASTRARRRQASTSCRARSACSSPGRSPAGSASGSASSGRSPPACCSPSAAAAGLAPPGTTGRGRSARAMAVLGIGVGFAFAAMSTLIAETVRPAETGVANGHEHRHALDRRRDRRPDRRRACSPPTRCRRHDAPRGTRLRDQLRDRRGRCRCRADAGLLHAGAPASLSRL